MIYDIQHYETTKELLNNIIIESVIKDYQLHVLYSIPIQNIYKDDIVSISTEFEVTQNNAYMTMIGSYVILSDAPYSPKGDYVVQPNGFNLDNRLHHAVPMHHRQFKANKDYLGTYYLNVVIYSSSTDAKNGDVLKIEQNYGHLDAVIFHINN